MFLEIFLWIFRVFLKDFWRIFGYLGLRVWGDFWRIFGYLGLRVWEGFWGS